MGRMNDVTTPATFNWTALHAVADRESRRWIRDRFDADEAAQEALLRAWRNRGACRGGDPRPWMAQIARREAFRLLARRRDERTVPAPEREPVDDGHDDLCELRIDLARALGALDPGDRALLYARYALDLTQPAAAAMLDMPEGTAKVRLHRLRRRLADTLER
jgi:RNA polymerase sigma-70 factor (ECF subfamily)